MYPNGNWVDIGYTLSEYTDDHGHIKYYGLERDAMFYYDGEAQQDKYGKIIRENETFLYYEDGSCLIKNQKPTPSNRRKNKPLRIRGFKG